MKVSLPSYHRAPNKFVRYEIREFHGGQLRIAHYLDKHNKPQEMVAQVIWEIK